MMARVSPSLRSRFQGCLVGAVVGDCIGQPYESGTKIPEGFTLMSHVCEFVQKLDDRSKHKDKLRFTDDTAMARSVAASLIDCKGQFDARDMAQRFSKEYAKEPHRGYGLNVVEIFPALGDTQIKDIYAPARTLFDGSGSYGNGGAMRVAPVGLCPYNLNRVFEIARESAKLTHSNNLGYNGAILQACAVHSALHADLATFDPEKFLDGLLKVTEKVKEGWDIYSEKLKSMKEMLKTDTSTDEVVKKLGHDISAQKSVPTAVFSFLRCLQPVPGIPTDNPVERTIIYAVSLDGDTDTIASMAGAITGAFHGIETFPKAWMEVCEGTEDARNQADQLYAIMTEGGLKG